MYNAPWRQPTADPGAFFNYDMGERTWKEYQRRCVHRIRNRIRNQIFVLPPHHGLPPSSPALIKRPLPAHDSHSSLPHTLTRTSALHSSPQGPALSGRVRTSDAHSLPVPGPAPASHVDLLRAARGGCRWDAAQVSGCCPVPPCTAPPMNGRAAGPMLLA